MTRGFLGLGSNLGDKRAHLDAAIAALRAEPGIRVPRVAGRYRTDPMGPQDQDWYINTVVEISTDLEPRALLQRLQAIEQSLGRVRAERWGPRTIDLDLLWLDGVVENSRDLTLPHAGAHLRSFVLAPWNELAPDLRLRGRTLAEWLAEAESLGLARLP
jgi:2-amino-4-hydroxy-6-hydroxymethyldihydropteridine diphosphokinase